MKNKFDFIKNLEFAIDHEDYDCFMETFEYSNPWEIIEDLIKIIKED